jgi:hypothetical protein
VIASSTMSGMPPCAAQIDNWNYLFVQEIAELPQQGLRVVVADGLAAQETVVRKFGDTEISGRPVKPSGRECEIVWKSYVAYSVRNESYFKADGNEEVSTGGRFRFYSKSHFLSFVSRGTIATDEYPGTLHHYSVLGEDHIVDVVSVDIPEVRVLPIEHTLDL